MTKTARAHEEEFQLIATAVALIGSSQDLSPAEQRLCQQVRSIPVASCLSDVRTLIRSGQDPLGEAFVRIRSAEHRRKSGATYTPAAIIASMIRWAKDVGMPGQIVDPGAGSGRFLMAASQVFPKAHLIGIEIDPVAALLLRANIAVLGLGGRTTIHVADYRAVSWRQSKTPTLFIGNPPYVRHHDIPPHWKSWLTATAESYGVKASQLAGLHIHFFVQTLRLAQPGDYGAFITAGEWLDVNYGAVLRKLLTEQLGGLSVHVLDPTSMPFADATTTGAITCFNVGAKPSHLHMRMVTSLHRLNGLSSGKRVPIELAKNTNRWSILIRPGPRPPSDHIALGDLFRVHRGQVTGNNHIWITDLDHGLPDEVLIHSVTKAKEIIQTGPTLSDAERLRKVIDLPVDLDQLDTRYRPAVNQFLRWAKAQGVRQSYVAQHRQAWWAVKLREPAPILCTYMARRAPAFTRNLCAARHINIAHGLYPVEPLSDHVLDTLITWLHGNLSQRNGRTYAGGLTKFEPKELERVPIPSLDQLAAW